MIVDCVARIALLALRIPVRRIRVVLRMRVKPQVQPVDSGAARRHPQGPRPDPLQDGLARRAEEPIRLRARPLVPHERGEMRKAEK